MGAREDHLPGVKYYFIGRKSELPRGHLARATCIFTTRWMHAIRAQQFHRVVILTFNPDVVQAIVRVTNGHNWRSGYTIMQKKYKQRGTLNIIVLNRG